jgi:hypothetical protein
MNRVFLVFVVATGLFACGAQPSSPPVGPQSLGPALSSESSEDFARHQEAINSCTEDSDCCVITNECTNNGSDPTRCYMTQVTTCGGDVCYCILGGCIGHKSSADGPCGWTNGKCVNQGTTTTKFCET